MRHVTHIACIGRHIRTTEPPGKSDVDRFKKSAELVTTLLLFHTLVFN